MFRFSDGGGPIHIFNTKTCMFHVFGVTEIENRHCVPAGSPANFARVFNYITWIEYEVWG
jgi:hypothetical protein